MNEGSSVAASEHSFFADQQSKSEKEKNKNSKDISKNSSNPEKNFENLNKEIKLALENNDTSNYSNSNSKISEHQLSEQYLDPKYCIYKKKINNDDSLSVKTEKNKNKDNILEEKLLYYSEEHEKFNKYDEVFDIEEMEEKTEEKNGKGINQINSIKINKNNLDNMNNLSNSDIESNDKFVNLNTKFRTNHTPNKTNNKESFINKNNNNLVHSFIETMNKYPSLLSKSSFLSTNNSSNNKIKKDEEYCTSDIIEENNITKNTNKEEIKYNNTATKYNNYRQGNKFGPHLNSYSQMYNNNLTFDPLSTVGMYSINNINNNNYLYHQIPKMNLNMVYYIPIQQTNNNKIYNNFSQNYTDKNINTNNIKEAKSSKDEEKNNKKNYIQKKKIELSPKNDGGKGEKNVLKLEDIISGKDTRTTVMIRNIPIKYTEKTLIEALDEFKGKYDCLYMPYDYDKKGNKGYAFINFINPLHIIYFYEKFRGKKWELFESSKICELNSANFQGIHEIQKHSKNIKGSKKIFYSDTNNNNNDIDGKEDIVIHVKYLDKLKLRFPKMKYHEYKNNHVIIDYLE